VKWTQKAMREVASEERAELGLDGVEPLDPYALAAQHGIKVYPLRALAEFGIGEPALQHFSVDRTTAWSAALVPLGTARIIVENDAHPPVRRRSNIAHELGHFLLEHPFDDVILGEDHKRQFDKQQEKEAKFMSGELLVPLAAASRMAYQGWDNSRVASAYGVSEQFAQMQMNGQRVRADRASKRYGFPTPGARS
jgi:hypothetical protein